MKKYFQFSLRKSLLAFMLFIAMLALGMALFHQSFRGKQGLETEKPEEILDTIGWVSDQHIAVQSLFFHEPVRLHSVKIMAANYNGTAGMEYLQYSLKDNRNRVLYENAVPVSEIADNAWLDLNLGSVSLKANERCFLYLQGAVAGKNVVCPTFYTMKSDGVSDILYTNHGTSMEDRALCAVYRYDILPVSGAVLVIYICLGCGMFLLANSRIKLTAKSIPGILAAVYVIVFGGIMISICSNNDTINRILFQQSVALRMMFLLFAVLFLYSAISVSEKFRNAMQKLMEQVYRFRFVLGIIFFLILFLGQYRIASNLYQRIGWDAGYVWDNVTDWLTNPNAVSSSYIQIYPNNIGLGVIFYLLRSLAKGKTFAQQYWILVVVSLLCVDFAIWLLYQCSNKLFGFNTAVISTVLLTALFGFSGWIIVPYTDTYTMFLPVLVLLLYCYFRDTDVKTWIRAFCALGMALLGVWGYHLKPQCLIIYVAIGLVELISLLRTDYLSLRQEKSRQFVKNAGNGRKPEGKQPKRRLSAANLLMEKRSYFVLLLCTIAGIVSGIVSFRTLQARILPDDYSKEYAMPMEHFLMMGLNENPSSVGIGSFCHDDVEHSTANNTNKEKKAYTRQEIRKRLKGYGLAGLLKHCYKKAVYILGDGSFFWQIEGEFYQEDYSKKDSAGQEKLREYYYGRYGGYDDTKLQNMLGCYSGLWFFMLWMAVVPQHRERGKWKWIGIVAFAVMGSILFPILFEARSRYLINYLPFFALMAGRGIVVLWKWMGDGVRNICKIWRGRIQHV